jgi:ABC-type nitrate/sulfonate/bicarbonate transport system permease component
MLLIWDMAVRLGWIDKLFVASPYLTIVSLNKSWGMAIPHLKATLWEFGLAFFMALSLGIGLGLVIGVVRYLNRLLSPVIPIGITIPKVTLLPLFILWFGIGKSVIIIYAMISGFFPMIINTMAGVSEVKPSYIIAARSMGYSTFQIYRKVVFPSMLPVLSSGLFLCSVHTMMGVFIVEMALARIGLGALIYQMAVTFRTGELYAVIVFTACITLIINGTFWYISREFSKWRA